MKTRTATFLFAAALSVAPLLAQGVAPKPRALTIADVTSYAGFYGVQDQVPKWSESGKALIVQTGPDSWMHLDPYKRARVAAEKTKKASVISSGKRIVFVDENDERRTLVEDDKLKQEIHLSPTSKHVAFVSDHNLVVVDTKEGTAWQATKDGNAGMHYGRLDWVYQEELYGRGKFRAHWWSPDGNFVAFLGLDQKDVKPFTIVDHVNKPLETSKRVRPHEMFYPKAGDPNPKVKLGIADVSKQKVTWVDLSRYEDDRLIVRVTWSADSKACFFQVQDRIQTWLDLVAADPVSGKIFRVLREESKTWVNILGQPKWLADGGFLWLSERTGYKHVYRHDKDGKLVGALTSGEWQVREVLHVDKERKELWFTATKDGATQNHAYRVGLDGKGLVRVTQGRGWHKVGVRADGDGFVETWSNVDQPAKLRVCDRDGKEVAIVSPARSPRAVQIYGLAKRALIKIKARDGRELDASIIQPAKGERTHPVWVDTYSGPDFPSVHDRWGVWGDYDAFHQFLAQQGFLVLQVNVRSASGRGQIDTQTCYKSFGAVELKDLEDAVDHVCKEHGGDPKRVGIGGWSYGGFMAAYALTHSKKFRLGIAGAGVYDWRLYDTIYTERYMRKPQDNAEGYKSSSVVAAAGDLAGHLVLIHGTQDDNVHLQNVMCLVEALQKAGKPFDLMLYPKMMHSPAPFSPKYRHMYEYRWRMIRQHLLPAGG